MPLILDLHLRILRPVLANHYRLPIHTSPPQGDFTTIQGANFNVTLSFGQTVVMRDHMSRK